MNFLTSLRTLLLALVLSIGISYAYAAWSPPSTMPTGGNAEAPVNVGGSTQVKSGALAVNGLFQALSNVVLAVNPGTNVGIGVASPIQKLDIQGGVKIAVVSSVCTPSISGTIMYDGKFKGCDGLTWVELGGSGGSPPPPPPPDPTVTINANDTQIPVGYPTTLTWTSANAASCVASGAWSGGKSVNVTASESLSPSSSGTFTITCTNGVGVSASANVSVDVRQWAVVSGIGNPGETCRQWLSRTGQAGVDGSPPRMVMTYPSEYPPAEGRCVYISTDSDGNSSCSTVLNQDDAESNPSWRPSANCSWATDGTAGWNATTQTRR